MIWEIIMSRPSAQQSSKSVATNPVYAKTPKGREELNSRKAGLNMRQRSVLIMLDGSKPLDAVKSPLPKDELQDIIAFLTRQELITIANQAENQAQNDAVNDAGDAARPSAPAPLAPHKLREAKDFMTTTAQTYLGLLAADLIRRIEHSKDAAQLQTVLGQWHMALRDSKHGHKFATIYLEQISATLRGE
jgi:hypothetical protein